LACCGYTAAGLQRITEEKTDLKSQAREKETKDRVYCVQKEQPRLEPKVRESVHLVVLTRLQLPSKEMIGNLVQPHYQR
jgi:hypothetical protein